MERQLLLSPPAPVARRKGAAATRKWVVVQAAGAGAGEPRVAELGKHRIMEMTGLPTRDLRVLDPDLDSPSTILGRERAIVVNLEHVKVIVTATEALVLDSSNPLLVPFLKSLHTRLSSTDISCTSSATDHSKETDQGNGPNVGLCRAGNVEIPPFEFKVLEVCLEHTCKCLENETLTLEKEAYPALDELITKVSRLKLEHVRNVKNRLVAVSGRVQKVRDEIEHLLDDDMDMSEMYLTRKLKFQGFPETLGSVDSNKDASRDHNEKEEEDRDDETETVRESSACVKPDVEELEMLLEAYFVQIDGTLNKLYHIKKMLDHAVSYINLKINEYSALRNSLLDQSLKKHDLREYVDDTEDYINIMLDEKQNQLLQMGVLLTAATVVVTAGIVVVSLFGMNIHIELMKDPETNEQARIKNLNFWETTLGTVFGCLAMYLLAIYAGKRSQILH